MSWRFPVSYILRQSLIVLVPLAAIWMLFGPSSVPSYRYKLTIEVNTPEGVKRGHNIVEVRFPNIPRNGSASVKGDALYLDLGSSRRPLIALVGKYNPAREADGQIKGWDELSPTRVLISRLGIGASSQPGWIENIRSSREVFNIPLDELPTLVTFTDPAFPRTILEVDPYEPSQTLGTGVSIRRATLEITESPLTDGIEKKLPWLAAEWPLLSSPFGVRNGVGPFPQPINHNYFMLRMHR